METAQQINADKYQKSGNMNARPAASTRLTGSAGGRRDVHGPMDGCGEGRDAASTNPFAGLWAQLYDQSVGTSCNEYAYP